MIEAQSPSGLWRSQPRRLRKEISMVPTILVILTAAVLYWFPIRRWMSRWGTTPSDLARVVASLVPRHADRKSRILIVEGDAAASGSLAHLMEREPLELRHGRRLTAEAGTGS